MTPVSPNFAFLKIYDLQLVRLGTQAERYFLDDPNTCLIKLRQFAELLAQILAAKVGLYESQNENQVDLLRRLQYQDAVSGQALDLFHQLRKTGNDATHSLTGERGTALSHLKYARSLGVWFHRAYGGQRNFKAGPFVPPQAPVDETDALKAELDTLRAELEKSLGKVQDVSQQAQEEKELRELAEKLLIEAEAKAEEIESSLQTMQAETVAKPAQEVQTLIAVANSSANALDLDERETRRLIDQQLVDAGWQADSEALSYKRGVRPQKGVNIAIAEWPTASGPADYALFTGLQMIAVVEAKRQRKDVAGAIPQAKRYSRDVKDSQVFTFAGGPWGDYKVPFVFATNGRAFVEQLRTKSGIWFCDLRKPDNLSRPHKTWYSPQGLLDCLAQDNDAAHAALEAEAFNFNFDLRDYQERAIRKVEAALGEDRRELLLAMATGTGKTKTSIAMVYRLLKTKRFRRVLFLVDRTALGEQATEAFTDTRMESLQTFANIFDVKGLKDSTPDRDTKVHITTVQGMVKRLLYPSDGDDLITADRYDCIVIDECHRGYLLDKEMTDLELEIRDFKDYVSKYRQVLEHFDAVKIGMTATPALHTTEIFGAPVYTYSYREAVIDGWLIDHEPPIRIMTALAAAGIAWESGEAVEVFDPKSGQVDLTYAPDEIHLEVQHFNKQVVTESFNRVVCEELAQHIDPALRDKTLIFCATDHHADMVVDQMKQALRDMYGSVNDDDVVKITGAADKPLQLIRQLRNEVSPKIAVTVDLLTTGIDVPSICNLVFIRRVNSRILYEQMLGRATRKCEEIGKEIFRVFDAVNLYENIADMTTMKPVVVKPNISFGQLVGDLDSVETDDAVTEILEQIVAKLQRKKRHLSDQASEAIETLAGMAVNDIPGHLQSFSPQEAAGWWHQRRQIAQFLDRRDGGANPVFISHHEDELLSVEHGYGSAERPEDYLDGFKAFLRENLNKIPALMVVTQRPRDLTRVQLKELRLALDAEGFSQTSLQVAWRETTNEDIAASIVGFIRQATLGDALMSYEERVDKALKQILASRSWTMPQRRWLERIGKQLKVEYIVDREALDQGQFKQQGGFRRINKIFDGQLETVLADLTERLWQAS